jgi:hypothetical protein
MNWSTALEHIELTRDERVELKNLLRLSIAAVRPHRGASGSLVEDTSGIAHALCRQSPDADAVAPSGYIWRGRPPFIDRELLSALRGEAALARKSAIRATKHPLVESSPIAKAVLHGAFAHFVSSQAQPREHFMPSSTYYHWYETEQDFVEPHVDTEEFAMSMLMLLKHERPSESEHRSGLFLWPPGSGPTEVPLEEGEAVLFYSGSVVHARSAPGPGEPVTTVSWGFQRAPGAMQQGGLQ